MHLSIKIFEILGCILFKKCAYPSDLSNEFCENYQCAVHLGTKKVSSWSRDCHNKHQLGLQTLN